MKKIYVVGIGPGDYESMTLRAERILRESDVIVGYTVYVDLLREHFPDKKMVATPMKKEKERCLLAFEEAGRKRSVAFVCSGDSGVYGMAGLILELCPQYPEVEVEMVPGITAALSGGALLGAPLVHDFAAISLSDLLTPWEKIETRLRLASEADFTICLYNPCSKKRADYLERACRIMLESKSADTVCGAVRNVGRVGESWELLTLSQLAGYGADMFTTVFVGNSQTRRTTGCGRERMVTPRGYRL